MKYIILSDGKGTRWNNYLEITKQEVIINNERLIDRTIRMILERSTDDIYIYYQVIKIMKVNMQRG